MRPDKQLAGLLGLTDAGTTLANAYLQVQHGFGAGRGHRRQHDAVPRHGRPVHAERRHVGRDALLDRDDGDLEPGRHAPLGRRRAAARRRRSPTTSPAPSSTRARATRPGRARSATASAGIRPDDLFYGARAGDVQPDWIDTNKIAIPQADEQQRLLLNLITQMERDKLPLPRFWYLPRGEKAAVVMSGDDHSPTQAPAARRATSTASRRSARPAASSRTGTASARPRSSTRTRR